MLRVPAMMFTAVLCVPGALAQRMAMGAAHPASPASHTGFAPGVHRSSTRVFVGNGFSSRPFRRNWANFGWPYFAGYGYGYGYDSEPYEYPAPEAPAAPPPRPAVEESEKPLPGPVLLELHGDQWVQVNSFRTPSEETQQPSPKNQKPGPLPPAVLVFRDGHTEEVSSYSIIGPVIYTKSDYWASGNWNRKIQIADLDVPATLQQNQERGVKFELPSGPDEVMIRP
jgi:hypothetical protein